MVGRNAEQGRIRGDSASLEETRSDKTAVVLGQPLAGDGINSCLLSSSWKNESDLSRRWSAMAPSRKPTENDSSYPESGRSTSQVTTCPGATK